MSNTLVLGKCPECGGDFFRVDSIAPSELPFFETPVPNGARMFYHLPVAKKDAVDGSFCVVPNDDNIVSEE